MRIAPFRIAVSDAVLGDLRERLGRPPFEETCLADAEGVPPVPGVRQANARNCPSGRRLRGGQPLMRFHRESLASSVYQGCNESS